MKKVFVSVFAVALGLTSFASDSAYTINGKFDKVKKGMIYLYVIGNGTQKKDSSVITDGKYFFKGYVQKPANAILDLKDDKQSYFRFYLEPGTLTITGIDDSLELLSVSGSKLNDDDKVLKERMGYITKWETSFNKAYGEAMKSKNKEMIDSLDDVDIQIMMEKRKVTAGFVKDYPNSMRAALAITENYAYYAEASEVEPLYNMLDKNLRNSPKGEEIKKMIETFRSVAIGKVPQDFTQTTPDGKQISLSSLKGKYVLVDFWASWCQPCRRENPNIVKTYDQYKDRDFQIFGVSYDTKKANWEKAIQDDKLFWLQVSDLQGWKNSTSDMYGIKAIPANLLLDKDGKIIAKNLFGKKLTAKLSEVMK